MVIAFSTFFANLVLALRKSYPTGAPVVGGSTP
jgi:hypothetical protein